jgi:hypothetical protein
MSNAVWAAAVAMSLAVPAVIQAQEAVELKLKWSPGTRVVQRMQSDQSTTMTMPGMPEPIKQGMKQVQDFAMSVVRARPAGGFDVEVEFLAMRTDISGRMSQTVDCAAPSGDPQAKSICAMIGAKLLFAVDAKNNIEKVEGFDALLAKVLASSPEAAAMLKDAFNEETMKQMMTKVFAQSLPSGPVKVGDSWPYNLEMPLPKLAILVFNAKTTFKGWETRGARRCAVLGLAGTMTSKPIPSAMPGMSVSLKSGTTTGKTWFDPELGMAVEGIVDQDMTMDVTAQGQSMNMVVKSHTVTTVTDVGEITAAPVTKPKP